MIAMASLRPDHHPILDTSQNQLGFELNRSGGIDANALGVLGANIAVLIYIAQAGFMLVAWQWLALLVPFVVSLLFNVMTILWPHPYRGNVSVHDHPEYLSMDEEDLLLQLIANTEGAVKENAQFNQLRLSWFSLSVAFTVMGTGILAYYLL
jgi:hypothetical protein